MRALLTLLFVSLSITATASEDVYENTSFDYIDYNQQAPREISTFAAAPQVAPAANESQIETLSENPLDSINSQVATPPDTADLTSEELADLSIPQSALAAKTASNLVEDSHQIASVPSDEPGFQIKIRRAKK